MRKGDLPIPNISLPKSAPCYGFMELESWGQENLRPHNLYWHDLDAKALELMVSAQKRYPCKATSPTRKCFEKSQPNGPGKELGHHMDNTRIETSYAARDFILVWSQLLIY